MILPPSSWPQEKQKNSETVSDAKAGVKWEEFLLCFFFTRNVQRSEFPRLHTEVWNNKSSKFQTLQVEQFFLFQEASFLNLDCGLVAIDVATSFNLPLKSCNIPGGTGSSGSSIAGFEGILCQGLDGVRSWLVAFNQKPSEGISWFKDATNPNLISALFLDFFEIPWYHLIDKKQQVSDASKIELVAWKWMTTIRTTDAYWCLATHLGRGGRRHFSDSEWCPGDLLRTVTWAKVGENSPVDGWSNLNSRMVCEIPRYTGMGGESGGVIGMMEANFLLR